METQVLTPADWPLLKAARLQALKDSPQAFLSHHEIEAKWDEHKWEQKADSGIWVIAQHGVDVIGIARSRILSQRPLWERYIESVWVAPEHRGTGVARELLNVLVKAEPSAGIRELWLWLLDDNDQARRTYKNLGFIPTGFVQPLRDGSGRSEERWYLPLHDGPILA